LKRKLITLGIAILLLFSIAGLTACDDKDVGISFQVSGDTFSFDGLDEQPVITKLVKSMDELNQLCDENGIGYEGEKYNEAYFEEKAIILRMYWLNVLASVHYDSVQIADDKIVINITSTKPKGNLPAQAIHYSDIIELSKSELQNATEIQINTKNKTK